MPAKKNPKLKVESPPSSGSEEEYSAGILTQKNDSDVEEVKDVKASQRDGRHARSEYSRSFAGRGADKDVPEVSGKVLFESLK